jgi:signal transduction histidine kinase
MEIKKSISNEGEMNSTYSMSGNSPETGKFYFKVIENAGGIPFRLIFGKGIGEGHYIEIGEGIFKLAGIRPEEFTEKLFQNMIQETHPLSPGIPEDTQKARLLFIKGEIKNYRADLLLTTPHGIRKWVRDTSLPLIDEKSGTVIGAYGILNDITNIKPVTTGCKDNIGQTDDRNREPEDIDQLKVAFLQNISHEMRTPLNAIVGFSTLLAEQIPVTDERREYLDIIARNSDHLTEIIDDIVEISRITAKKVKVEKESVNLNRLLRRVYDRYSYPAAEKGIMLVFAMMPDKYVSEVIIDTFKVTQILRYLVENAVKFTDRGKIEFGYELNNGMIEFYVSDTGKGIPIELHDTIFRSFNQAGSNLPGRFEGIGFGLALSKAYVELLDGNIWYETKPGGGSLFRFRIPEERAEEDIVTVLKREKKVAGGTNRHLRL